MEIPSRLRSCLAHRTNKVVDVYSIPLGVTYYVLMISLSVYVGYVQIYQGGGYQTCESPVGTVMPIVRGSALGPKGNVWDAPFLVLNGGERDAIFLTTSMLITSAQKQGTCVGVSPDSACTAEGGECVVGEMKDRGAVADSACFESDGTPLNPTNDQGREGHCLIRAWCPLQSSASSSSQNLNVEELPDVADFEMFVRASAKFPLHNAHLNNLQGESEVHGLNVWKIRDILRLTKRALLTETADALPSTEDSGTETSVASSSNSGGAPATTSGSSAASVSAKSVEDSEAYETMLWAKDEFGIDSDEYRRAARRIRSGQNHRFVSLRERAIAAHSSDANEATEDPLTFADVSRTGAVILFTVDWDCNLDTIDEDGCVPSFDFQRLDRPDSFTPGFEYEFTNLYSNATGGMVRDLYTVRGLRFLFQTTGRGCNFDLATLSINIGAGLAIVAVASVVTDALLLYLPWPGTMQVRDSTGKWITVPSRQAYYGVKVDNVLFREKDKRIDVRRPGEKGSLPNDGDSVTAPLLPKTSSERRKHV